MKDYNTEQMIKINIYSGKLKLNTCKISVGIIILKNKSKKFIIKKKPKNIFTN